MDQTPALLTLSARQRQLAEKVEFIEENAGFEVSATQLAEGVPLPIMREGTLNLGITPPIHMAVIRLAQEIDAQVLCSFAKSFPVATNVDRWRVGEHLKDPNTCLLVAFDLQELEGYLLGFDHFSQVVACRVAEVDEIMVGEHFRRKGIGSSLMKTFEDCARERGCPIVIFGGAPAAHFYRAVGYQLLGTVFIKRLV